METGAAFMGCCIYLDLCVHIELYSLYRTNDAGPDIGYLSVPALLKTIVTKFGRIGLKNSEIRRFGSVRSIIR